MSNTPANEPITYQGKMIWNINTWKKNQGYVTFETLKSYGNLFSVNIWTQLNVFQDVLAQSVNGVNSTVFSYLTTIRGNVQDFIDELFQRITSVSYFDENKTTYIKDNMYVDNLASKNDIQTQTLNVINVNTQKLTTFKMNTNTIHAKSIITNSIQSATDIGVYLQVDIYQIPLMKSQMNLPEYAEDSVLFLHLKCGYAIICKDINGNLLLSIDNNTDDFMYFIPISNKIRSLEIYMGGKLL
jgi:hypothetical protein